VEARSPRANRLALPRWLNVRLGAGLLLVLLSTLLGAKVVAAADTSETVWAARRDMPPGYRIAPGDVSAVSVRLGSTSARYVAAAGPLPDGYVLARPVVAGELLPRTALVPARRADPARRIVAVPVRLGHWPRDLAAGDLVDLYATPKPDAGATGPPTAKLVMSGVPVQSPPQTGGGVFSSSDGASAVELDVPVSEVAGLVLSLETSDIDVVRASSG
jgi:hypothetical protein